MGWERKRGKLQELNRLLRGATDTTYVTSTGTLALGAATACATCSRSTPTRACRAKRRAGSSARWRIRSIARASTRSSGRVVEGYAILQPRVAFSLPVNVEASPFQRVFSGAAGVDPYAAAVSDVYQDLLGEGSFAGKGIYDVDAFEAALAGRVPESTLLSHDLFEGIFARAGLASDVEVVEEFPARYDVASLRQHRWVRGDWQLLPWIFGRRDVGARAARPRSQPHAADRPVEDARQPAPLAVGARQRRRRWSRAGRCRSTCAVAVVRIRAAGAGAADAAAAVRARILPRRSTVTLRSHLRALRVDFGAGAGADRAAHQHARLPGLAHGRRHRPHAVAHVVSAAGTCSNGSRPTCCRARRAPTSRSFYRAHGAQRAAGARRGRRSSRCCPAANCPRIALPFLLLWLAAPAVAWRISRTPPRGRRSPSCRRRSSASCG